MQTETITWTPVAAGLPDDGTTVLVETEDADAEPIWLGYLDGEQWRMIDGMPVNVVRWADMPRGVSA